MSPLRHRSSFLPNAGIVASWRVAPDYLRASSARKNLTLNSSTDSYIFVAAVGSKSSVGTYPAYSSCNEYPFMDKFAFVLSWYTASYQGPSFVQNSSTVSSNASVHIDNQREITYLLRGAQYGLLHYVRKVYVVVDADVIGKYGPARDLVFSRPDLDLIRDIAFGVARYDVFPTGPFDPDILYDHQRKKPYVRMSRLAELEINYQGNTRHSAAVSADVRESVEDVPVRQAWADTVDDDTVHLVPPQ